MALTQLARHRVEGIGEIANLISRIHDGACIEVSGGHRFGLMTKFLDRSDDAPRGDDREADEEQTPGECDEDGEAYLRLRL